ncbi:hypothetical protein B0H15DRAFT_488711 [Mycena belliarum]|uniref:Uncharacterized protein n=1 Tax=Mycena belliarum TaxID=1033014 RepID=A0AAD6XMG6_9AGAR|nr:hypothetical protein B0H15DRAFT_488711 [Mycena belliae]
MLKSARIDPVVLRLPSFPRPRASPCPPGALHAHRAPAVAVILLTASPVQSVRDTRPSCSSPHASIQSSSASPPSRVPPPFPFPPPAARTEPAPPPTHRAPSLSPHKRRRLRLRLPPAPAHSTRRSVPRPASVPLAPKPQALKPRASTSAPWSSPPPSPRPSLSRFHLRPRVRPAAASPPDGDRTWGQHLGRRAGGGVRAGTCVTPTRGSDADGTSGRIEGRGVREMQRGSRRLCLCPSARWGRGTGTGGAGERRRRDGRDAGDAAWVLCAARRTAREGREMQRGGRVASGPSPPRLLPSARWGGRERAARRRRGVRTLGTLGGVRTLPAGRGAVGAGGARCSAGAGVSALSFSAMGPGDARG